MPSCTLSVSVRIVARRADFPDRGCGEAQPQRLDCNRTAWNSHDPLSVGHTLRLVLRTQPRSVGCGYAALSVLRICNPPGGVTSKRLGRFLETRNDPKNNFFSPPH